jgi:hypothetical protein
VDHSLIGQVLHHAPGGQFVVVGTDELRANRLEGKQKTGEVGEAVEIFGLGQRDSPRVMPRAEFNQRGGRNGAFEMQMQLGLGKPADKLADRGHDSSLLFGGKLRPVPAVTNGNRQALRL